MAFGIDLAEQRFGRSDRRIETWKKSRTTDRNSARPIQRAEEKGGPARAVFAYVVFGRAQKRKSAPPHPCLRLACHPPSAVSRAIQLILPVAHLFTNVAPIHARGRDGNPPAIAQNPLLQ